MITPDDYALYRRLRGTGSSPAEAVHRVRMRRGFRALNATMKQITEGFYALGRALAPAAGAFCAAMLKFADARTEAKAEEARRVAAMQQWGRRKGRQK